MELSLQLFSTKHNKCFQFGFNIRCLRFNISAWRKQYRYASLNCLWMKKSGPPRPCCRLSRIWPTMTQNMTIIRFFHGLKQEYPVKPGVASHVESLPACLLWHNYLSAAWMWSNKSSAIIWRLWLCKHCPSSRSWSNNNTTKQLLKQAWCSPMNRTLPQLKYAP